MQQELIIEKRGNVYVVNGEQRTRLVGLFGDNTKFDERLRLIEKYFETLNIKRLVAREEGGQLRIDIEI